LLADQSEETEELTVASVNFRIMDYDLMGPADFHEDRKFNKANWEKPWLKMNIKFESSTVERSLDLQLEYALDEIHLQISK